jgi:hypothetical protein
MRKGLNVGYLFVQMFWWIVVAALLGFVVGWRACSTGNDQS